MTDEQLTSIVESMEYHVQTAALCLEHIKGTDESERILYLLEHGKMNIDISISLLHRVENEMKRRGI